MHTTIDHLDAHDWLIETILEAVEEAMNGHKAAPPGERRCYFGNVRTLYNLRDLVAAQGTEHHHNHEAIALAALDRHGDLPPAILAPLRRLGFHGPIDDLDQWLTDWLSESTTDLDGAVQEADAETETRATRPR